MGTITASKREFITVTKWCKNDQGGFIVCSRTAPADSQLHTINKRHVRGVIHGSGFVLNPLGTSCLMLFAAHLELGGGGGGGAAGHTTGLSKRVCAAKADAIAAAVILVMG